MMAFGVLVTVIVLPDVVMLALPLATAAPVGAACAVLPAKQEITAIPISLRLKLVFMFFEPIMVSSGMLYRLNNPFTKSSPG
jgi:hypothetical protein